MNVKQRRIIFIASLLMLFLAGCTTPFNFFQAQVELAEVLEGEEEKADVAFTFCALKTDDLACNSFNLTDDSLDMELEVLSSDVSSVDSVVFELPDEEHYCTADTSNGFLSTDDGETYSVYFTTDDTALEEGCEFSDYLEQDVQLSFEVAMTYDDGSSAIVAGNATDTIFADE